MTVYSCYYSGILKYLKRPFKSDCCHLKNEPWGSPGHQDIVSVVVQTVPNKADGTLEKLERTSCFYLSEALDLSAGC